MNRHEGCLEELPEQQEEVLLMRTGIDAGRSYDRQAVAQVLHLTLRREGQLEAQAVTGMGRAVQRGCPVLAPAARRAAIAASTVALEFEQLAPAALGGTASAQRRLAARSGRSRTRRRQAVSAAGTHVQQGAIPVPPSSGSSALLWILLAAGLVAATAVATPVVRRRGRLRPAGATAGAPPIAPSSPEPEGMALGPAVAPAEEAAVAAAAAAAGVAAAQAGAADGDELGNGSESAVAAYRHADAAGDPHAATNLGVLLEQQGDFDGAIAAYRRADERGDINGSFNLGCLLADLGDTPGALAALRRTDDRGDAAGASNLGVLLEREGDLDGALSAYRRADDRGDANGAFNLGLLLAGRGDLSGARAAYRRAAERGNGDVEGRARTAMDELDGQSGD